MFLILFPCVLFTSVMWITVGIRGLRGYFQRQ